MTFNGLTWLTFFHIIAVLWLLWLWPMLRREFQFKIATFPTWAISSDESQKVSKIAINRRLKIVDQEGHICWSAHKTSQFSAVVKNRQ